jgi:glycosyltransferase involved in cell wall biosynthesis
MVQPAMKRPLNLARQSARTAKNLVRFAWQDRWRFATGPIRRLLRWRVRQRKELESGATVLIANWQTKEFLAVTVERVLQLSTPGTRIIVVDNGSTDGSRQLLKQMSGPIRKVLLPVNVGHGVALDLAALLARTEWIVALDVDAFPISPSWLEDLSAPLRAGASVSGARASNGQIAPCFLMMSLRRFVERRHTFTSRMVPGNDPWLRPHLHWDVGRRISVEELPETLHAVPRTDYLDAQHQVGEIFSGVVYHNGYATVALKPEARGDVRAFDASASWQAAIRRFGT